MKLRLLSETGLGDRPIDMVCRATLSAFGDKIKEHDPEYVPSIGGLDWNHNAWNLDVHYRYYEIAKPGEESKSSYLHNVHGVPSHVITWNYGQVAKLMSPVKSWPRLELYTIPTGPWKGYPKEPTFVFNADSSHIDKDMDEMFRLLDDSRDRHGEAMEETREYYRQERKKRESLEQERRKQRANAKP